MHILALDALLAVVQSIEGHCHSQLLNTVEKAVEENFPNGIQKKKKEKSGNFRKTLSSEIFFLPVQSFIIINWLVRLPAGECTRVNLNKENKILLLLLLTWARDWVSVVLKCTMGLFWGRYLYFHWLLRSWAGNCPNLSPKTILHCSSKQHCPSLTHNLQMTNKWNKCRVGDLSEFRTVNKMFTAVKREKFAWKLRKVLIFKLKLKLKNFLNLKS